MHALQREMARVAQPPAGSAGGVETVGVRDYYPWWAAHAEHQTAGKVFPISTAAAKEEHHVLFDDNVHYEDSQGHSIIDLRDATDAAGEAAEIVREAEQRVYMVRVDPHGAITDRDYFVAELAKCVRAQQAL
jgi:hypothetical protein